MASTLINTIAQIPSNPDPGDIIRFGAVITTGIPNTIKKADGATTENRIGIGNEYRWYGTNWLKIGGDSIETIPLKDATILDSSEFENMIMAAVHNNKNSGRLRKFGSSILHRALQSANALGFHFETIYNETVPNNIKGRTPSIPEGNINLDYKSGSSGPRYSFDDYIFLVFFAIRETRGNYNPPRLGVVNTTPIVWGGYALGHDNGAIIVPTHHFKQSENDANKRAKITRGGSHTFLQYISNSVFNVDYTPASSGSIDQTVLIHKIDGIRFGLETP